MTITLLEPQAIVDAAQLLLQREIVLPTTVWQGLQKSDFQYKKDDTVTLRIPAKVSANKRVLRSGTPLERSDVAQTSVDVKLTDHLYILLGISDEDLTLSISNFAAQILAPQIRGVAEGLEDTIADCLASAHPLETVTFDPGSTTSKESDPYKVLTGVDRIMNTANVPRAGRVAVLGTNVAEAFLDSDRFSMATSSGETAIQSALQEAMLRRTAGFTPLVSNALDPNEAYAYIPQAVAYCAFAPGIPAGAPFGAVVPGGSLGQGLRYIRDYNPEGTDGPEDRSLVDAFSGATSVETGGTEDAPLNEFLVKIDFAGDES